MSNNSEIIISKIRSYKSLPEDWDGHNGMAPTDQIINDVICFLEKLTKDCVQPTYEGISGDGEIDLFWDFNNIYIDVVFTGNKKYSYYGRKTKFLQIGYDFIKPIKIEIFGDDISIEDPIPEELINLIKKE